MPNTKKKHNKQSRSGDNGSATRPHHAASSSSATCNDNTNSGSNVKNAKSALAVPTKLKNETAKEHHRLCQELEEYIDQFRSKAQAVPGTLDDQELIVLFVLHLHPRWKRLIEPEEIRFKTWEEAAKAARYHAIKLSAILGAEREDNNPMFTTKEAKDILASGYFKPDQQQQPPPAVIAARNKNSSKSIDGSVNYSIDDAAKPTVSNDTVSPSPTASAQAKQQDQQKKEKENIPATTRSNSDSTAKAQADVEPSTSKEKQQVTSTRTTSSSLSSASTKVAAGPGKEQEQQEKKKDLKEVSSSSSPPSPKSFSSSSPSTLTHTQRRGKLKIPAGADPNSVCYKLPSAHTNVNLPFLDIPINGQRVRALLAKKRWGASAMSVALQQDMKLPLNRSEACDIGTEFGQVEDAIGSVICLVSHPANPSLEAELAVQVMPALYGGRVDLILGADFFFYFTATFSVRNSTVRYMGLDAHFVADKFTE
ncbi:hypothetical protein BDB00DRAFT_820950 [Zychaea mexicana]|uniref:uncharacterized protein n=1 Tax=Zychaea mexicana TaxID=64656 RepID=UPI0022FEF645|nr:uncharacterized protein BDB00DRAFT_820950 [Zychaea mexicana]KAI9493851.1 hypothetical protein BDB00DRAFT_820950 [Zychaea mexicana]